MRAKRNIHKLLLLAAFTALLAPLAEAQATGYSTLIQVTDQNKQTAPTDKALTYIRYGFAYSGNAPNPQAAFEGDRVARAWVLVNVNHEYHNGQTFIWNAEEENTIVYKVIFNGMTIEYRTHMRVIDSGWNLVGAFKNGMTGRGQVVVEYKVYNETGVLIADERDEEIIGYLQLGSLPDSRIWIQYQDGTLTVTPDFTAHGLLPRYFQQEPPASPGRVQIQNVTYESLEIEIIAAKTLQIVKVAYGFGKPGHTPGYTLGSLVGDAATSLGGLIGNVIGAVVEFVFKFIPQGEKLLVIKEYIVIIFDVLWEILAQDPVLLLRVIVILSIGYGLLLWVDPMFRWLFMPFWMVARTAWRMLLVLWYIFLRIVSFISSKIPGA